MNNDANRQMPKCQMMFQIQVQQFLSQANMIDTRDKIVNSNCQNFLCQTSHGKQVYRIQPDKFTFLKSNLLISNIINKSTCKNKKMDSAKEIDNVDAYVNCEMEMQKLQEDTEIKKSKIDRVRTLAKCKSQMNFEQLAAQKRNEKQMIQNVYLMRKESVEKAASIMGKKQDNLYLGRKIIKQKEGFLKQLKQTDPSEKILKAQTVRLLMKENAEKCNRRQLKQLLQDSANGSITKSHMNNTSVSSSIDMSFFDVSNLDSNEQKVHNDEILRKLMKCKSSETFMQEQKRRAIWNGFSENWRKGCEKHEEANKKLKKKANKKAVKAKFQTSDNQILNYHDQFSRLVALKRYENAFADTASSFKLKMKFNQAA